MGRITVSLIDSISITFSWGNLWTNQPTIDMLAVHGPLPSGRTSKVDPRRIRSGGVDQPARLQTGESCKRGGFWAGDFRLIMRNRSGDTGISSRRERAGDHRLRVVAITHPVRGVSGSS